MKPVVLIGGGGHAVSVLAMNENSTTIAGYTALTPSEELNIPYIGTDQEAISSLNPEAVMIHNAVGFTTGCSLALRRKIAEQYSRFEQATLIAPSAWVSNGSRIAEGCAVMARAVINESVIGAMSVINTGAIIEHNCLIGSNAFIGPGAIVCGGVTIGDDTFIGAGAIIKQGVEITAGVVIGMGAVVTQSITTPGTYIGNPAKKLEK
jgi:UDP-perosamine 4-acetyltransferase